jgi:rhodanese-related sulfurtransferase
VKQNLSKILSITIISILISLLYNHFNPNGLSLIREGKRLKWESDSLIIFNKIDSSFVKTNLSESQPSDSIFVKQTEKPIESFSEPKAIKLDFAYKLFKDGIKFIDSRSVEEFSEGHIRGAVNIPFYGSENHMETINRLSKNETVVTYCSSADCDISVLSGEELFEMGFKRVYVYVGGYEEWTKNNYPTSK